MKLDDTFGKDVLDVTLEEIQESRAFLGDNHAITLTHRAFVCWRGWQFGVGLTQPSRYFVTPAPDLLVVAAEKP
jgi:hypothetical protein